MIFNLVINETLLERALSVGGLETENETVTLALEEFIDKRAKDDVISLFNTVEYDEGYDYKKFRGKR
ncbi:MAG: type II toxin-antitoxin system VapB family antitoxin [Treponema sp.]|nr:type II toxin-antitoxin system VapB family antitoxin [Treponema sp.]